MRRYGLKLYLAADQQAVLHRHREMAADLWNALLQRCEHIQRTTTQRQVWHDADGNRHVGVSYHRLTWETYRKKSRERAVIEPGKNGKPKPFTDVDMQNEITAMLNELPEWRGVSVWCCHRTAQLLWRAFQAFFARAKAGAGAQSGYPRYHRRQDQAGIPHRFASGCKLTKDPRHAKSWQLTLLGVPGKIHARGEFPFEVEKWADADVIWRNGEWSISVCVEGRSCECARPQWDRRRCRACGGMRPRPHGAQPVTVRFDLLDSFALVDNYPVEPPGLIEARVLQDRLDAKKSECDTLFPRGARRRDDPDYAELRLEISRLAARIARIRANALHVWTSRLVARASDITVIAPPVRELTQTPKGSEKSWGAQVAPVSALNRDTLAQAPAAAIRMLQYKAEEAGIRCDIVKDDAPKIAVGRELVTAGKQLRRSRRAHRKETKNGV
jgi:hypothetical protein